MESKMNISELSKSNEKVKLYKADEELIFNDIKEVLENINYNYDTDNTSELEGIELELLNKLKIINQNHNSNVMVIEKNIANYKRVSQDTEKIFSDLM